QPVCPATVARDYAPVTDAARPLLTRTGRVDDVVFLAEKTINLYSSVRVDPHTIVERDVYGVAHARTEYGQRIYLCLPHGHASVTCPYSHDGLSVYRMRKVASPSAGLYHVAFAFRVRATSTNSPAPLRASTITSQLGFWSHSMRTRRNGHASVS